MRRALVASLVAVGFAAPAAAQREASGGFLLSAHGGYVGLNFKESARAVLGSTGGATFGGDIGYVLGEHLFFTAGARFFSRTGERVFVTEPGGTVFKLGHPLKLRLVPVQATVGWRILETRVLGVPLTPYIGLGGGVTSYREESTVAGETRTFQVKKTGGHALAGLELGGGPLRFAVEASYSTVPNAIGDSPDGVSRIYGEKDIGGFTVLGKIVFTTAGRR